MIPARHIIAWQQHAPWQTPAQVEQDLVLCRAIADIYSDDLLGDELALRGGTALHKLFPQPAVRYSEDIDLVRTKTGPARKLMDALRARLSWLGKPKTEQKRDSIKFVYRFDSETPPIVPLRLKIEMNTREHRNVYDLERRKINISNPWYTNTASTLVFSLDELLSTKLRALYQRKKGRDLFDLHIFGRQRMSNSQRVVKCFLTYMKRNRAPVSRAKFEENFAGKLDDPRFGQDISPLLAPNTDWDIQEAARYVRQELLTLLPGEPWKGMKT